MKICKETDKCRHKKNGEDCNGTCDEYGHHAMACKKGGHVVLRHDAIKNVLTQIIRDNADPCVYNEQNVTGKYGVTVRADIIYREE